MRILLMIEKVNKLTITLVLLVMLVLTSCSKFTELSPQDALSEETAFTDAGKIDLVVKGMYESAQVGSYEGGGGRGYPFGAASIIQAEMRGEDMVNLQAFYDYTYSSTITPTTANNKNMWEQLYALINQANVIIDGVSKAAAANIITEDVANQYGAEAKFLRALAHHELVINFCKPYADNDGNNPGVPYRIVATNSPAGVQENLALGRGTVAEDYENILKDLDEAEEGLPEANPDGISRATKGAAIALKTRVKLHKGDWEGVILEGTKLGTSSSGGSFERPIGSFKLDSDPTMPFTNNSGNTESIFSIANSPTSNPEVNGALPQMFGPATVVEGVAAGRGLVALSPNLFNASFWVEGDKRRSELTVQMANAPNLYFTYKYREYTGKSDWAPIIRYAEVLLNVAEAEARSASGNKAQAFALLNAVRNRSVPETQKFTSPPSDIVLAILQERRIEFSAEGRRWPDIHRLVLDPAYGLGDGKGIPAKIVGSQLSSTSYGSGKPLLTPGKSAINYSDYRFLWPIPTTEITSNPTLAKEQNPGY